MTNLTQPIGNPLAASSAQVSGTRALSVTVEQTEGVERAEIQDATVQVATADADLADATEIVEAQADTPAAPEVVVAPEAVEAAATENMDAVESTEATIATEIAEAATIEDTKIDAREADPAAIAEHEVDAQAEIAVEESASEVVEAPQELEAAETVAIEETPEPILAEAVPEAPTVAEAQTEIHEEVEALEPIAPEAVAPAVQPVIEEIRIAATAQIASAEIAYDDALVILEQASQSLKAVLDEAGSSVTRLSFKMLEFAQVSAKNNLDLARDYISVRTFPEIIEVQTCYLKRQFDLLTTQVEALNSLTAEVAAKTSAPFKAQARH